MDTIPVNICDVYKRSVKSCFDILIRIELQSVTNDPTCIEKVLERREQKTKFKDAYMRQPISFIAKHGDDFLNELACMQAELIPSNNISCIFHVKHVDL